MAINEVIFPHVSAPVAGDWAKAIELIEKAYQNVNSPLQVDLVNDKVPEGATFQVGGHIYHADADEPITGTSSDYVKLTVSGTTLVPTYVANLTPVSWNKQWNGYYDSSDDYYVFDEAQALVDSELSSLNSKFGELFEKWVGQALKPTDDVTFNNVDIDGVLTIADLPVPDYGDVGTIIIAGSTSWSASTQYLPNTTVAGSTLVRSTNTSSSLSLNTGNNVYETSIAVTTEASLSLTGTWRLLTRIYRDSNTSYRPVGLLQRIS